MKKRTHDLALMTIISCVVAATVSGDEPRTGLTVDELIQNSGVLKNVDQPVADLFRKRVRVALDKLPAESKNNIFDDDEQSRELAVELVKFCLSGRFESDALFAGMAIGMVGRAMPRKVVAEGLARAIYARDDPLPLSDPLNDLARYVYKQDGPGDDPDLSLMVSQIPRANVAQREKLIAHLLAYSPAKAFRSILETERVTMKDAASLSWFDRRLQEVIWAEEQGVDLEPDFAKTIKNDFESLMGHEKWWVRLYALELLTDYPRLSDPSQIKQLSNDSNRFVQKRASALLEAKDWKIRVGGDHPRRAQRKHAETEQDDDGVHPANLIQDLPTPSQLQDAYQLICDPTDFSRYETRGVKLTEQGKKNLLEQAKVDIEKAKRIVPELKEQIKTGVSVFDYPGLLAKCRVTYNDLSDDYEAYVGGYFRSHEGKEPFDFRITFDKKGLITKVDNVVHKR